MPMRINSREFAGVLCRAAAEIESKSSMNALRCVRLDMDGKGAKLHAIRLEGAWIATRYDVPEADVSCEAGTACFEPGRLVKWLKAIADTTVEITLTGDTVVATAEGRKLTIPALENAGNEYPELPSFERDGKLALSMRASAFVYYGRHLDQCALDDSTQPHLHGIAMDKGHLVATDGHRLVVLNARFEASKVDAKASFIVPRFPWRQAIREAALADDDDLIFIQVSEKGQRKGEEFERTIRIESPGRVCVIRVRDKVDPIPWENVMPRIGEKDRPILAGPEILAAVREIRAIADRYNDGLVLRSDPVIDHTGTRTSSITVAYRDNSSRAECEVVVPTSEPFEFEPRGFNFNYLEDGLKMFGVPAIFLTGGPGDAMVIQAAPGGALTYVLMPKRI